jgi:tetratricopeptide (TPR) repeat protein
MQASSDPVGLEYAQLLNNLGRLYFEQRRYGEAGPLYARSLAMVQASLGRDHPKVARRLVNLAELHFATGKHSEADACYQRALAIEEKAFGPRHSTTVSRLRAYAAMLRKMHRIQEAEAAEARAYLPRPAQDLRATPDRRGQEIPTSVQAISMPERRRSRTRRTDKVRRRS